MADSWTKSTLEVEHAKVYEWRWGPRGSITWDSYAMKKKLKTKNKMYTEQLFPQNNYIFPFICSHINANNATNWVSHFAIH